MTPGSSAEVGSGQGREPTLLESFGAIRRREVYLNVPIHLFVLIPAVSVLAWMAHRIDRRLELGGLISPPWSWVIFAALTTVGVVVVWYSYGYLAIRGEGGPATHLGGTTKLVTTGPYLLCRHPSIIGKFLGVLGFAFLVGSPTFLFVLVPLLTTYSLFAARYHQERICVKLWGEAYLEYRRSTPLVLPDLRRLRQWPGPMPEE